MYIYGARFEYSFNFLRSLNITLGADYMKKN